MPAHAQRMSSLLVLDKEFAPCRVAERAYSEVRGPSRKAGGGGQPQRTQRAGKGSTEDMGAGHGEERT